MMSAWERGEAPARAPSGRHLMLQQLYLYSLPGPPTPSLLFCGASVLQVGTFSVPLRGLLRQGQQVVEVLHECPIHDTADAVQREGSDTAAAPASAPLRGSILVRLINRACNNRPGEAVTPGERAAPASTVSPSRQQPARGGAAAAAEVVVRARPALDEEGEIAVDLASREGVSKTAPIAAAWQL